MPLREAEASRNPSPATLDAPYRQGSSRKISYAVILYAVARGLFGLRFEYSARPDSLIDQCTDGRRDHLAGESRQSRNRAVGSIGHDQPADRHRVDQGGRAE